VAKYRNIREIAPEVLADQKVELLPAVYFNKATSPQESLKKFTDHQDEVRRMFESGKGPQGKDYLYFAASAIDTSYPMHVLPHLCTHIASGQHGSINLCDQEDKCPGFVMYEKEMRQCPRNVGHACGIQSQLRSQVGGMLPTSVKTVKYTGTTIAVAMPLSFPGR